MGAAPWLFKPAEVLVGAGTLTTEVYVEVVGPLGPLNVAILVSVVGVTFATDPETVVKRTDVCAVVVELGNVGVCDGTPLDVLLLVELVQNSDPIC